jgi:hypothetical protein
MMQIGNSTVTYEHSLLYPYNCTSPWQQSIAGRLRIQGALGKPETTEFPWLTSAVESELRRFSIKTAFARDPYLTLPMVSTLR